MKKMILLFGAAIGYVAGAAAGRERYEQIRSMAKRAKDNPQVQEQATKAADAAKEAAPVVKDKASGAADSVSQKSKGEPSKGNSTYPQA